jgi:hypothetical protein
MVPEADSSNTRVDSAKHQHLNQTTDIKELPRLGTFTRSHQALLQSIQITCELSQITSGLTAEHSNHM